MMNSKQAMGVMNLSVPILGANETVLAVMTSPFIKRLDTTEAPDPNQVIDLLKDCSADISKLINAPA
jgi:DNA-binding IclR family transcriptional regulator